MASSERERDDGVADTSSTHAPEDDHGQVYRSGRSCRKHATPAVIDARGKRVGPPHVLETNGKVLVEFFELQPGTLHVCLEEGTQSAWLAEILSPHVDELVVVHVSASRADRRTTRATPMRWPSDCARARSTRRSTRGKATSRRSGSS
jgi:hypothetical protein